MQCSRSFALLLAGASLMAAQGLSTNASKDDWEEVNFEFNSSVLSDGYPSLLRLAELLHQNADYRVSLDGNTDSVGSKPLPLASAYTSRMSEVKPAFSSSRRSIRSIKTFS